MRNLTQDDLTQLSIKVLMIKVFDRQIVSNYSRVKSNAIEFMDYINKEFHTGTD